MISFAIISGLITPFGALLGYIWFALFRPQEWVWVDISAFRFSLVLGMLLLLRSAIARRMPNITHPNSMAMLAFLGVSLVAQQGAVAPRVGWQWLEFLMWLVLVTLLLISIVDTQRRMWMTILTISASFGFHTTKAGIASLLGGGIRFHDGLAGAFLDNNAYAIGAVMIMPFLWAAARTYPDHLPFSRWLRRGLYAAIPLTGFTVIGTLSRSGFLALLACTVTCILLSRRKFATLLGTILLVIVMLPVVPTPKGYSDRLETINTYESVGDTSALSRLHFWKVALRMAIAHPFGVGLFNFEFNYDKHDFSGGAYGLKRAVHSSPLQILTETGFLGLALYLFLFFNSYAICLRIRKRSRNELRGNAEGLFLSSIAGAIIASMTAFLVGGSFISMGLNDLSWFTFGLAASLDRISASLPPSAPLKMSSCPQ